MKQPLTKSASADATLGIVGTVLGLVLYVLNGGLIVTAFLARIDRQTAATWAFSILAGATVLIAVLVSRGLLPRDDVLAAAVAMDLLVTVPLLFLVTVVATGRARPLAALVVLVGGGLMVRLLVPEAISWTAVGLGLAVAELMVISMAVAKIRAVVRRAKAAAGGPGDLATVIQTVVADTIGSNLAGRLVAADITLLTYATVGWWRHPELPREAEELDTGGGSIGISLGLGLAVLCEGLALHPLLWRLHPTAAVVHGLVAGWALLWILGDLNGLRLRPSYTLGDRLVLRQGLRWQLELPSLALAELRQARPDDLDFRNPDRLDLAGGDGPTHVLELSQPCTARGLFQEQEVLEVAVRLVHAERLLVWQSSHLGQRRLHD